MTRYVLDAGAVLQLARKRIEVRPEHELLAPTLLRSQTLDRLHRAVAEDEISPEAAREQLEYIGRLPIRLLGDAVLRRKAWTVADQLGWASTLDAEYVALTLLQGDAYITLDKRLAREVEGMVKTAPLEALGRPD
jgi:predicted nucleic acid-binding protein